MAAGKKVYGVVNMHMYTHTSGFSLDSALLCFRVGGSVMTPHQSVSELFKLFVHKTVFISNLRTLYRTGKKIRNLTPPGGEKEKFKDAAQEKPLVFSLVL